MQSYSTHLTDLKEVVHIIPYDLLVLYLMLLLLPVLLVVVGQWTEQSQVLLLEKSVEVRPVVETLQIQDPVRRALQKYHHKVENLGLRLSAK